MGNSIRQFYKLFWFLSKMKVWHIQLTVWDSYWEITLNRRKANNWGPQPLTQHSTFHTFISLTNNLLDIFLLCTDIQRFCYSFCYSYVTAWHITLENLHKLYLTYLSFMKGSYYPWLNAADHVCTHVYL